MSDTRAKRSFIGSHDVIAAIDHAEKVCRTDASATVWAEAIRLLTLDNPDVDPALDAYAEARHRGVIVNVQLAQALIFPLCNASPPQLAPAMGVYADLTSEPVPLKTTRDRDRLLELYTTLLRAASRVGSLDIATRLIKDLRARSLPLPPSGATSILIAIMRIAPGHHAAFGIYAHFHALNGARLSANDYSAILACFLDTKKQSPFAPPKLYLEIVQDMRRSGFRPDSQVLASLLRSYGARATGVLRSSNDPAFRASHLSWIHKAIKDLHIFLRLDELVEVDVPLLNALMDAYSRVGAYTSAFEVWGELVERRAREDPARVKDLYGPSISIALDTCGRSDQLGRARRIWAWARHHGLDNPHTWDTWVECLCRLGKLDEAVDVVCNEMKEQQAGAPRPTKDTLEVLLRFAWSREDLNDVPRRVMQDFPEMWEDVSGLLERKVGRLLQARKERGMVGEQKRDEQMRKEDELAEREDVSPEQLEQVLQRLAQAGKRGAEAKE
jgi:pentatricopeptide repeat protein